MILPISSAVFHILTQFSTAVTYSVFVTLGLITSVPVSAGELIEIPIYRQSNQTLLHFILSTGHRSLWCEFRGNEIGRSHFNFDRILFGHVSQ